MRTLPDFRVGQKVRLNDAGFSTVRPRSREECQAATQGFRIMAIDPLDMCDDVKGVRMIEVDGPFAFLMLTTAHIEACD